MSENIKLVITIVFPLYLVTVLFTGFSFTGYWTDYMFSILLTILSIKYVLRDREHIAPKAMMWINRVCSFGVIIFLVLNILNPFSLGMYKMRSFYFQSVGGRLFNAYFRPVGANSGGYGNFWITETAIYFPLIEYEVHYNRTVDYDFNDDSFEGQPTDNYKVVRNYITREVIEKETK